MKSRLKHGLGRQVTGLVILLGVLLVTASNELKASDTPPLISESARLIGSPDRGGFGQSVGLSGKTIAIGAANDLGYRGLGFLFRRPGAAWQGAPAWIARLASSVEIPANSHAAATAVQGRTVVTGSPLHFVDGNPYQGSAQVFVLPESGAPATITETAVLRASDGVAWSYFGSRVAIEGDTVLVSAPADQARGAVYVFARPPGGWAGVITESAKLVGSQVPMWAYFGSQIGISGGVVVAGVPGASEGGQPRGAVYVFTRPSGGWNGTITESAKLTPSVPQDVDFIGGAVTISGDTVVAGAIRHTSTLGEEGAAYVFTRPPGGWQGVHHESAILLASDRAPEDFFGGTVAISGRAAVVGALRDDVNNRDTGSVYLFVEPPGGWTGTVLEGAKLVPSDPQSYDAFAQALTIEGDTVVAGAPFHAVGWNYAQGTAYVFDAPIPRDFGDAPAPYPSSLEDDGARHHLAAHLFLGDCADSEEDARPTSAADGDEDDIGVELVGSCAHDRDDAGVAFSPLRRGAKGTVRIAATNLGTLPATLRVWIDWNDDGDWSEANELVVSSLLAGKAPYPFEVPQDAVTGPTYARVRLSTASDLTPQGFASDGEVEDLVVEIRALGKGE